MSVTSPRVLNTTEGVGNPAAAAETVIATLGGISTRNPGGSVILRGLVNIVAGVAATSVTLRLRRGNGTTGTQVGTSVAATVTAADSYVLTTEAVDTPGDVADQQYSLTAQVTAATAVSTVDAVSLTATY